MNIEEANNIQITTVLSLLNHQPYLITKEKVKYYSPFLNKRRRSFIVLPDKNTWYDAAIGKGGKTLDFVCAYLAFNGEDNTQADGLRWLSNMMADSKDEKIHRPELQSLGCRMIRDEPVEDLALTRFLESKGINVQFAKKHMKEVTVRNPVDNTIVTALGLRNENGGYELEGPIFKNFISPRTIIFIRGKTAKPNHIHFFKDVIDYLTFLTINGGWHDGDVIVITSDSCIDDIKPYIKDYGYRKAFSWMNNTRNGLQAAIDIEAICSTEPDLKNKRINKVYAGFQSLNAWHTHNLNLG